MVSRRSIFEYRRIMAPDGIFVLLGGSRYAIFQAMFLGPLVSIASKKKMGVNPMNVDNEGDLRFLLELIEKGKLRPVIDRRISLDGVPEALMDLSEGLVNGKVVVDVQYGDII
jgi:NADPH:quinone reductase-like Zn-dependent oxidoreductase